MEKVIEWLAMIIKLIFVSLLIVLPVRYFLFQPFYVSGASMEPSFFDNEYLIIDEISYRFNKPQRGEVVVFKNPTDESQDFIKRIIALPGEKVQVDNDMVKVFNDSHPDGWILSENYLPDTTNSLSLLNSNIELGEDEYFVMGDNRAYSKDSRYFGPIKFENIIGKVVFRGWPISRAGVLKTIEY